MQGDNRHTVLLLQYNASISSRTYLDYDSLGGAMDGICAVYEKELKSLNPHVRNITYDVSDLYTYLEQLSDISCLVFHPPINAYLPRNREWIKKQIFSHLRGQAGN